MAGDNPFDSSTVPGSSRLVGRGVDAEFQVVVIEGRDKDQSFLLDATRPPRVAIGYGPSCELRLGDPQVSRRHAALDLCGPFLRVTDLGSTNGTYVNGVSMIQANLHGGEIIQVGRTSLRVDYLGPSGKPQGDPNRDRFGTLLGVSVGMRRLFPILERLANSDVPVLVEGEAGTGKQLAAEAIHEASARAGEPLVVVDCGALNAAEQHQEIFGSADSPGALERAGRGAIVLVEIASLAPPNQSKLVHVIERGEIRRGETRVPVTARIMATTRDNLDLRLEQGRFREDLLSRLDVGRLELLPLRRREGDVPFLAEAIWERLGGDIGAFPHELLARMADHTWPGNVRELENVLARKLALGDVEPKRVRSEIEVPTNRTDFLDELVATDLPWPRARERALRELEQRYVTRLLRVHDGNVARAAAAAGIARRYFDILRTRKSE